MFIVTHAHTHTPVCVSWLCPPAVCSVSACPPGEAAGFDSQPEDCEPVAEHDEPERQTQVTQIPHTQTHTHTHTHTHNNLWYSSFILRFRASTCSLSPLRYSWSPEMIPSRSLWRASLAKIWPEGGGGGGGEGRGEELYLITLPQPVRGLQFERDSVIGQRSNHRRSAVAPALWSPVSPWRCVKACRRADPPARSSCRSSRPTAVCNRTTGRSHGPEKETSANQSRYHYHIKKPWGFSFRVLLVFIGLWRRPTGAEAPPLPVALMDLTDQAFVCSDWFFTYNKISVS